MERVNVSKKKLAFVSLGILLAIGIAVAIIVFNFNKISAVSMRIFRMVGTVFLKSAGNIII